MRTLFALALVFSFSGLAHADYKSERLAQDAIRAYADLANEAQNTADYAYPRGHFFMHGSAEIANVRALDNVSDLANSISRKLHQAVLRPLRAGASEFRVDKHLDHLKGEQVALDLAVRSLGANTTSQIARLTQEANHAWRRLDRSLGEEFVVRPPQPEFISASCVGKSGGNFLQPKSHVECTVVGRGVRSYEVIFQNNGGAIARAQGPLDPRLPSQAFTSQKVQVGWLPQYTVFALTFNGARVQIAQGTCQH